MPIAPTTFRAEATMRTIAGVLYDPATVRFRARSPGGTVQTWTYPADAVLVRVSVGLYRIDWHATSAGVWSWRWECDGDFKATHEGQVAIDPSEVLG
jgi:hypothetical protein